MDIPCCGGNCWFQCSLIVYFPLSDYSVRVIPTIVMGEERCDFCFMDEARRR